MPARELWDRIAHAAWASADPGLQFDTTINDWHTCPASGRINASNPCSEYMFLDDTACNLASLNLMAFRGDGRQLRRSRISATRCGCGRSSSKSRCMMAQFPSREIARLSYAFRTLGLGYANLGGLLMSMGIPYDSDAGRALAAAITALMTGDELCDLGRDGGRARRLPRLRRRTARRCCGSSATIAAPPTAMPDGYEGLAIPPVPLDAANCPDRSSPRRRARPGIRRWRSGEKHGFRNAQATVIAPTGTIGLVMDCDTTGIEPDFALVKFKKLAGGGYFKIINRARAAGLAHARLRRRRDRRDRALCAGPRHA